MWRSTAVLIIVTVGGPRAPGQMETPEERAWRLEENARLLKVEMTTDRSVYFPGEPATITVTVTNPTNRTLEVPLVTDPEGFYGSFKMGRGWTMPSYPPRWPAPATSTVLPLGRSVTFTVHSLDKTYPPWYRTGATPYTPGRYRVQSLLGGSVEYEVAAPILEKGIVVPLHKTETYEPEAVGEQPVTEQRGIVLVAAQILDEHVVAVSSDDVPIGARILTNPDGTMSDRTSLLGTPWIRVATGTSKITGLTASVDVLDVITVEYTTSDGVRHRIPLDANRHPIL
jgi:hypothetical protein